MSGRRHAGFLAGTVSRPARDWSIERGYQINVSRLSLEHIRVSDGLTCGARIQESRGVPQPVEHLPWGVEDPFIGSIRCQSLSLFSTNWGICYRSSDNFKPVNTSGF
jgi:hypothetical protein